MSFFKEKKKEKIYKHKRATIIRTTKTITQKMVNFIAGFNNRWQQLEQQSNDILYIYYYIMFGFIFIKNDKSNRYCYESKR